jgi:hypothetical protein
MPLTSLPPEPFEEQEFHGIQPIVATRDINIGVMLRNG